MLDPDEFSGPRKFRRLLSPSRKRTSGVAVLIGLLCVCAMAGGGYRWSTTVASTTPTSKATAKQETKPSPAWNHSADVRAVSMRALSAVEPDWRQSPDARNLRLAKEAAIAPRWSTALDARSPVVGAATVVPP